MALDNATSFDQSYTGPGSGFTHGIENNTVYDYPVNLQVGYGFTTPTLTASTLNASGLTLAFDQPVAGTGIVPTGSGAWGFATNGNTTQPDSQSIRQPLVDVAPVLQSILGDAVNGLDLTFNLPVSIGTPSITSPVNAGWNTGANSQVSGSVLRIGVVDVPPVLQTISASLNDRVRLTFNLPVSPGSATLTSGGTGWNLASYSAFSAYALDALIADVPPTLTSVEGLLGAAQKIGVIFDLPVTIPGGIFPANFGAPAGWQLDTGTAANQINPNEVIFKAADVAPSIVSAVKSASGVTLTFDQNLTGGTGTVTGSGNVGWNSTSITQVSAKVIRTDIVDLTPTITQVIGNKVTGLDLVYDNPVLLGSPTFTHPVTAGWDLDESASQVNPTRIRIGVIDVVSGGVALIRVLVANRLVTLEFNQDIVVNPHGMDPTHWVITTSAPGAVDINCRAISVVANNIYLVTDQQTGGKIYSLSFTGTDIQGSNGDIYGGPTVYAFTAVGHKPAVIETRIVDADHIDLIFNEDVDPTTAGNTANYAFDPPLQVTAARRLSDSSYRLTVVGRLESQAYDLTVTNIRDTANNTI